MDDSQYMEEAFLLAERGRGSTHPNPLVGAVLVKDGEVVGRGWHLAPGEPHAEAIALAEAGERARGATLYCTLEPCSHHGKTPPCADALVAAGVSRAVVALRDPNPLVDGRGLRKLSDGDVDVRLDEARFGARAREQNAPFVKYHRTRLPLVTYKAAVTLDGKVAASSGDARWISCLDSRRAVHELRSRVDAVMVGAGTVRRDDPELTVRLADGRDPVRVVVTRDGVLPWGAKLLATADRTPTIVIAEEATESVRMRLESRGAELLEVGAGGLRAALHALAARGLLDVLCEGGPTLAGSLLSAGLIDRVLLFVAPLIVGRGAPDLFAAPAVAAVDGAWRLEDVRWDRVCDDLMLSGTVVRSGS
ncbi:MAG: bifunctional diaminohydroxyphosphoribosylaminopyrimidine deaminase/5-amino-6-(5-phosphoribosylamino)uracil reductase RibD [Actinobacteria bacterium]|nr:bifunctional diaminohydroxyphosphoribosylaminopyrimidine deaminase/5-amino-6-(5-phosphoribosylamino)uracil reductase RibD [Actinomycetota bacterium]